MTIELAEKTLSDCCIHYLNLEDFDRQQNTATRLDEVWIDSGEGEDLPSPLVGNSSTSDSQSRTHFFDYAASEWAHNFASINPDENSTTIALQILLKRDTLLAWSHQFRRAFQGRVNLPEHVESLLVAAYFGHSSITENFVSYHHGSSSLIASALTWASRRGHLEVVNVLIKHLSRHNVSCKGENVDRKCAFPWAVVGGFNDLVGVFLDHDESLVNLEDDNGDRPLSLVASSGHSKLVSRLLSVRTIDVNHANKSGLTAVMCCILTHDLHIAKAETFRKQDLFEAEVETFRKFLRNHHVDITLRSIRGRSLLCFAAERGVINAVREILYCSNRSDEVGRLLDDSGDDEGCSPRLPAIEHGHLEIVRVLCQTIRISKQLLSTDNLNGANAFDYAAKYRRTEVIKELAKHHPEGVHNRDKSGRTPLSVAMWKPEESAIRALMNSGADIDLPDFGGTPPISFGAAHPKMVKLLIEEYDADVNRADKLGRTPVSHAIHNMHEVSMKLNRRN